MKTGIQPTEGGAARAAAREIYDSYGLVLIGIILTLLILAVLGEHPYVTALGAFLLGGVFLLTLAVSSVKRRTLRVASAIVVPLVLASIVATVLGSESVAGRAGLAISALLVVASPVAIARRLVHHSEISARTVLGALCIYMFAGLFFAFVYSGVDYFSDHHLFTQNPQPASIDYIYFSFITLTTVGYGDLSPDLGLAKMAAVMEAIFGQLYLVTVVAVVVSNLGRRRQPRGSDEG